MTQRKYRWIGFSLAIILCSLTLVFAETEQEKITKTVNMEFRRVENDPMIIRKALEHNKVDGYKIIYNENEPFLVSEKSDVIATEDNIKEIFAKERIAGGNGYPAMWSIFIVFDNVVSQKILDMGDNNLGKSIAFLLNGKLVSTPRVRGSLRGNLNKDGQLEWFLADFDTQEKVSAYLSQNNLKSNSFKEMSVEEKNKVRKYFEEKEESGNSLMGH